MGDCLRGTKAGEFGHELGDPGHEINRHRANVFASSGATTEG